MHYSQLDLTSDFSSLFCASICETISFMLVSSTIPPRTISFRMYCTWNNRKQYDGIHRVRGWLKHQAYFHTRILPKSHQVVPYFYITVQVRKGVHIFSSRVMRVKGQVGYSVCTLSMWKMRSSSHTFSKHLSSVSTNT